jgi:nucleotide-binding universal stress UspA family protein
MPQSTRLMSSCRTIGTTEPPLLQPPSNDIVYIAMYNKILAAVNEHLNSEVAARYAMHLAKAAGGTLYLCHVAEQNAQKEAIQRAEEAMKRCLRKSKEMGITVEEIHEYGDPLERIRKIVRSEGIDIVFASTRQEDIKRRLYAGTMARKLSVNLPCSVALVRVVHMGRIHPKKILVPLKARIDHIDERAFFAAKMAEAFGSNTYLFHTTEPVTGFFRGEIHFTPLELENRLPKDISHFVEHLDSYKVSHEKRLVSGKVGRRIVIEAAARRFDLVIMGASERSLLSSLISENPVEELLRETPCDLIILKARDEDKQPFRR